MALIGSLGEKFYFRNWEIESEGRRTYEDNILGGKERRYWVILI